MNIQVYGDVSVLTLLFYFIQRRFDIKQRKCISGAKWNTVIDTFVDNFVDTDDGNNMYVGFNGVYGLVNGLVNG